MPATTYLDDPAPGVFRPVGAESGSDLHLSMQRLWLTGRILPAGGRLLVHHVFQSSESKPIEVVYAFALPRDAALRRFRIKGDGFTAHSKLMPTADAVKTYDEGVAQGSLSTLARQYGDGAINLSVGNIRPKETVTVTLEILAGVEAHDGGFRFRFPFTIAPGYHAQARGVVAGPGIGEISLPEEEFGDLILPQFHKDASALHAIGFDLQVEGDNSAISSPSHAIAVGASGRVSLAIERDLPNRDLVVDAEFSQTGPRVFGDRRHFAALIPSTSFGGKSAEPRRVVVLLDRSGSMGGMPIAQARKALEACLGALEPRDQFGIVAFDDQIEKFHTSLQPASREQRDKARTFLANIHARGGTELAMGVDAAASVLGRSGGDVLILTDGQVMGTERILGRARTSGLRLHCLGIGSASQDRFLSLLARDTGGISRFVTAQERVDLPAVDLFASIGRPVAGDVKVEGAVVQPDPPESVFAGTPVVVFGEEAGSSIQIRSNAGNVSLEIPEGPMPSAETIRLLQGARRITDLEARYVPSEDKRQEGRVGAKLRALSEQYGLASREMSLVAVVSRAGDNANDIPVTRVVPVGMPRDTSFAGVFGGKPATAMAPGNPSEFTRMFMVPPTVPMPTIQAAKSRSAVGGGFTRLFSFGRASADIESAIPPAQATSPADRLLDFASAIEDDGGMPGADLKERVRKTIEALDAFRREGNSENSGPFRSHVARLIAWLKTTRPSLDAALQAEVKAALKD